jgi:hypothetical protein
MNIVASKIQKMNICKNDIDIIVTGLITKYYTLISRDIIDMVPDFSMTQKGRAIIACSKEQSVVALAYH